MPKLEIDLQDGFQNDTVIIQLDDEQVFYKKDVKTSLATSLAAKVELDPLTSPASLVVTIPTRNLTKTFTVELPAYLAISIVDDEIQTQTSEKPFRYM